MDTQFKVINRTTRKEQVFNSSEFERFFECWYDEQTEKIKYKNHPRDYAFSTVKSNKEKTLDTIFISFMAVMVVIAITKLVMLWI